MKYMFIALAVASLALAGCAPNQTSKQGEYDEVETTTEAVATESAEQVSEATEAAAEASTTSMDAATTAAH